MDTDSQLTTLVPAPRLRGRPGIAMVTAIFALVIVGVLVAGMYNLAALQARAVKNRTTSTRALLLAETAAAHAVMLARDTLKKKSNSALLRGSDNATGTADDSLLIGFGLSSGVQIPAAGFSTSEGRYWVKFRDDDDGDGDLFRDSNMRIIAQCTAATPDSGYAAIDVVVTGISQMPGFFTNGNFSLGGNNSVTGACGDVHANGNLTVGNPGPILSGTATAGGTVSNGTAVKTVSGGANPAVANQAPLDVPQLPYTQFCPAQASYILKSNGTIENRKVLPIAVMAIPAGLTFSAANPKTWSSAAGGLGNLPGGGVICVEGNLDVSGNTGSAAAPVSVTLVATQSVRVQGSPYLKAATADSILIVAGADTYIAGNASAGSTSYEGLIYANSQCAVTGSIVIKGNVVCRNQAHTTAAHDWALANSIAGSATISYGCGGYFNQPRRILQWVQLVR